jgi:hypothetical protein
MAESQCCCLLMRFRGLRTRGEGERAEGRGEREERGKFRGQVWGVKGWMRELQITRILPRMSLAASLRVQTRVFTPVTRVDKRRLISTMAAKEPLLAGDTFFLDSFALRQWDEKSSSRINYSKQDFLDK